MSLVENTKGLSFTTSEKVFQKDPFESISSYRSCYFYRNRKSSRRCATKDMQTSVTEYFFFMRTGQGKSGENNDNQDTSVRKRTTGKKARESLTFERPLWVWRNCLGCLCKRDDLHVHHLTAHERKRRMGWKKTQESEKFMENEVWFPKPWKSKFGPWISSALRNFQRIHSAPSKYHFTTNYSTRV